jgi:hypothetical protein
MDVGFFFFFLSMIVIYQCHLCWIAVALFICSNFVTLWFFLSKLASLVLNGHFWIIFVANCHSLLLFTLILAAAILFKILSI